MKNLLKKSSILLFLLIVGLLNNSCDVLYPDYEVRIHNDMQRNLFGLPYIKYDVVEFKLGDHVFNNIPYGEYSDYVTVGAGKEYKVSLTVQVYMINDNGTWDTHDTATYNLETATWASNESYDDFVLRLTMGDLLAQWAPRYSILGEN